MATHRLYASAFYEDVLERETPASRRRQASVGTIDDAVGDVQSIAAEPGDRTLRGNFMGTYADTMNRELQELLSASDAIEQVPYFDSSETVDWRGYYSPREVRNAGRRDPRVKTVQEFEGALDFAGTRRSHLRRVTVKPDTVPNPFGTATTRVLWLANTASDTKWVNTTTGAIADATVQTTAVGEDATFAEYDTTEPSFSDADRYHLVYDLPYEDERDQDPVVWDTYGRSKHTTFAGGATVGSATVGTDTVDGIDVDPSWQRVYHPQHEYAGEKTIETGRLRLEPRPDMPTLRAYTWDDAEQVYSQLQLDSTSTWRLQAWDIRSIGLERIDSRTSWQDTSGSSTYELAARVRRGSDEVQFWEPANASSSTPAGLNNRLSAIASSTDSVLGERTRLMERSEVPDT